MSAWPPSARPLTGGVTILPSSVSFVVTGSGRLSDVCNVIVGDVVKRASLSSATSPAITFNVGGVKSAVTTTLALFVVPVVLFTLAVIVFGPSTSAKSLFTNDPLITSTFAPLIVTMLAAFGVRSWPATVMVRRFVFVLSAGDVRTMASLSGLRVTPTLAVPLLPARSVAAATSTFAPRSRLTFDAVNDPSAATIAGTLLTVTDATLPPLALPRTST